MLMIIFIINKFVSKKHIMIFIFNEYNDSFNNKKVLSFFPYKER